jgi:hypothetical protein
MKINRFNESLDFEEIVDIMQDIEDEGYGLVIYSANGAAYYIDDVKNAALGKSVDSFKSEFDGRFWKFRVDVTRNNSDYSDFVNFLKFMEPIVLRLKNCGHGLSKINPYSYRDSENFFDSVEFNLKGV